jgi:hypothetical protein
VLFLFIGIIKKWTRPAFSSRGGPRPKVPYPHVTEAFGQSDIIPLRSTPRHPANQSSFCKGQII